MLSYNNSAQNNNTITLKNAFFAVAMILLTYSQVKSQHINILPTVTIYKDIQPINLQKESDKIGLFEALNNKFDELTQQSKTKGYNACILLPDGSTWKRAYGVASTFPEKEQMTTDHRMPMGSITKSFISTTILLMIEDGLLSLDDSLYKYLSSYPNIDSNITIRQILSHTSGINDYLNENPQTIETFIQNMDSIWTIETILTNFVGTPNFKSGESWSYSNTNFLLAGKIIENITGNKWYEEVRTRILEPLNLSSIYCPPFESGNRDLLAHLFSDYYNDNDSIEDIFQYYDFNGYLSIASSAGSYVTTPYDLTVFMKSLFDNNFLSQKSLDELTTNYNGVLPEIKYGLGLLSYNIGIENWGHGGSIEYQSNALYLPEYDMAISVQQNEVNIPTVENITFQLIETYLVNIDTTTTTSSISNHGIKVYPTITNTDFYINTSDFSKKNSNIIIFNCDGRIIKRLTIKNNIEKIDVSAWPKGVYFIKSESNVNKIIVK